MRQNRGMAFSKNRGDGWWIVATHHAPRIIFLFVLLFFLTSCTSPTAVSPEITVFAASSLTDALQETAVVFQAQHPDTIITFNFAGSSQLAAQLTEGVPADVFASANPTQMQNVVEAGRITADASRPFVANKLTLIVPADNPAQLTGLTDLNRPNIHLILAVPGVPVRQYTDEIVAKLGPDFATAFYNNVVSEEENVRQVAAKIALGEADAGIIYTSDITPDIAPQVQQISIPATQNVIATYLIAPVANSSQPELARQFIAFILSPEGQIILAKWGFIPLET